MPVSKPDMTHPPDLAIDHATGPFRSQRPIYRNLMPPCNHACPTGEDIQSWLALAQAGEFYQAWLSLTGNNPFPAISGRVCYHNCETSCNRAQLDDAVSIHAVERFLGDQALEHNWQFEPIKTATGKKIMIVGAGPCGLAAAYYLRQSGHEVDIFDAGPLAGGLMHFGIPAYRLPRGILAAEIKRIENLGVRIHLHRGVRIHLIAIRANPQQTLMAMREAEAYPGPSLILAYSHCIAHGIDMRKGLNQQHLALESGYWRLVRFNPAVRMRGDMEDTNPFILDSQRPRIPLRDYAYNELRYKMLTRTHPEEAEKLMTMAEKNLVHRWAVYEEMATRNPNNFEIAPLPAR